MESWPGQDSMLHCPDFLFLTFNSYPDVFVLLQETPTNGTQINLSLQEAGDTWKRVGKIDAYRCVPD